MPARKGPVADNMELDLAAFTIYRKILLNTLQPLDGKDYKV